MTGDGEAEPDGTGSTSKLGSGRFIQQELPTKEVASGRGKS